MIITWAWVSGFIQAQDNVDACSAESKKVHDALRSTARNKWHFQPVRLQPGFSPTHTHSWAQMDFRCLQYYFLLDLLVWVDFNFLRSILWKVCHKPKQPENTARWMMLVCILIYMVRVVVSNIQTSTIIQKNVPSNKDRTIHNYTVMQPIKHLNIFILLLSCISTICNGL